jgi:hypothetical protein
LIQEKAIGFIKEQSSKQPFFLFLPYILPHAELIAPDDSLLQYYKNKFQENLTRGKIMVLMLLVVDMLSTISTCGICSDGSTLGLVCRSGSCST